MSMIHCFFWKQGKQVACVRYENGNPTVVKPKGEIFALFSEEYWKKWEGYTGYLPDSDELDFCLVYEDDFFLPESFESQMQIPKYSYWNVERIKECMDLLGICGEISFNTPEGEALTKIKMPGKNGSMVRKLRCRDNEDDDQTKLSEDRKLSPFTEYYLNLAKEDK